MWFRNELSSLAKVSLYSEKLNQFSNHEDGRCAPHQNVETLNHYTAQNTKDEPNFNFTLVYQTGDLHERSLAGSASCCYRTHTSITQYMKDQWRSEGTHPYIPIFSTDRGKKLVSCPPPYFRGKVGTRLDGPRSQSGRFGEDKRFLPLPGIEPWFLGCPAHSLVR